VQHERQRVSLSELIRRAKKAWHGIKLGQPDWRECSHSVAFTTALREEHLLVHLILNAYWEPLDFELPLLGDGGQAPWRRWIDTSRDAPNDIVPWESAPMVSDHAYRTEARCVVVLFAELDPSDVQLMARRESADGVLRTTTMPTAPAAARLPRSMRGECDGHLAPRDAAVRDQVLRAASETV
jgi:hypothetical protein